MNKEIIYIDQLFITVGTVIVTLCLTFIGTDHSLKEIFTDPIILKKLFVNSSIILLAWLGVRQIILLFDARMPWNKCNSQKRWLLQIPTTLSFTILVFLLQLYSRTFLIPEWELSPKTVWSIDFPLSLLFGLSFNFLYYHWWMQHQRQIAEKLIIENQQKIISTADNQLSISVKKGKKTIVIPDHEIAYAFRIEEFNYLVGQNGEKYLLDLSLNALEQELNEVNFFRLNRQLLASRSSIQAFKILSNRHLQVELKPELAGNLLVNKNKVASFKRWIKQEK